MLEHKQDPGQGAPRIPLALLVRTGQGLLAGVGAPGRAGEGGVGGRFVHRVTFCAEGNEFRLFSAQSVTLCTKCSPRRPHWSSLPGGPSPAWSHEVASCGVVRARGLVVGSGAGPSGSVSSGCLLVVSSCRGRGAGCLLPGSGGVQVVWGRGWSPSGGRSWCLLVARGRVAHSSRGPGGVVGVIPTFSRPVGRPGTG